MLVETSGKLEDFDVQITLPEEDSEWKFEMTAEMNSLNTLHTIRDARIKGADFLDIKEYPQMTFQSLSCLRTAKNQFELKGKLTLKGLQREVCLQAFYRGKAKDSYSGETKMGWQIKGEIDRCEWGVDFNLPFEGKGGAIGNKVKIRAELEFKKQ